MEHITKLMNAHKHSVRYRTMISYGKVNKFPGRGCTAAVFTVADIGAAFALIDETVPSGSEPVISLVQQYPLLTSAAAVVALGGVAIAALSSKAVRSQPMGAKDALKALKAEERTVLVDLRTKESQKEEGALNLKEANKKSINVCYTKPDDEGKLQVDSDFPQKLRQAAGITQGSLLILIDSDGSLAPKAAAAAAADGYYSEKVFWVRGGVEGPQGWKASDLPTKPYRTLKVALPQLALPALQLPELPPIDLGALAAEVQAAVPEVEVDLAASVERVGGAVNNIADKYKENPTLGNGVLAAASIAAVGAFAFTEFEAILQLVGAIGLARVLSANLLFAKDREATLAAFRAFLKERGLDQLAAGVGSATGSTSCQLRQLASIVMEAPDAESAGQQISEQMVPEVRGADAEALAAALAAAGVELPGPIPSPDELKAALADVDVAPADPLAVPSASDTSMASAGQVAATSSDTPPSSLAMAVVGLADLGEQTVKTSA